MSWNIHSILVKHNLAETRNTEVIVLEILKLTHLIHNNRFQ